MIPNNQQLRAAFSDMFCFRQKQSRSGDDGGVQPARPHHDNGPSPAPQLFAALFGEDDPDIQGARHTAKVLGTDHHEIFVRPSELMDLLPTTAWTLEDPGGYDAFTHLFALARHASMHTDVLFSGNICDTLFAGMPNHRRAWLAMHVPGARSVLSDFRSAELRGSLPRALFSRLCWQLKHGRSHLPAPVSLSDCAERQVPDDLDGLSRQAPLFDLLSNELRQWDNRMGAQTALANRFGMKFRMPFADKRMIELALRIPDRQKIHARGIKQILRDAAKLTLPGTITERKKYIQQFPYDLEFADLLNSLIDRLVSNRPERAVDILPVDKITTLRSTKRRPYSETEIRWLWNAISLEIWIRQFSDRRCDFLDRNKHPGPIAIGPV